MALLTGLKSKTRWPHLIAFLHLLPAQIQSSTDYRRMHVCSFALERWNRPRFNATCLAEAQSGRNMGSQTFTMSFDYSEHFIWSRFIFFAWQYPNFYRQQKMPWSNLDGELCDLLFSWVYDYCSVTSFLSVVCTCLRENVNPRKCSVLWKVILWATTCLLLVSHRS